MSTSPKISRYAIRSRRTGDTQTEGARDENTPSTPEHSSAEPSGTNPLANLPLKSKSPTESQKKQYEDTTGKKLRRHELTIKGRTFYGPLPSDQTTSSPSTNLDPALAYQNCKLFVCEDCPLSQENADYNLHELCYDTHPCIWSFQAKAREVFVNRRHWLALGKPLEETRLPSGKLPKLLDGDGEPITKASFGFDHGADPNSAFDEIVRWKYAAVIKVDEFAEHWGLEEVDERIQKYCERHRRARERMLECMSWGLDW